MLRNNTYEVKIGNVYIGKDHKIAIQSMCNIKTSKVDEVVSQILELENEGCDLIRVSILDEEDAYSLKEIVSRIHIPLIADIHFSSKLAKLSIINGASKIRLNPGNLKDENEIKEIIDLAKKHDVSIRIGVNSGSIPQEVIKENNYKMSTEIMLNILDSYIKIFEKYDFKNLVLALKSSSPLITLECYREASKRYKYPLHIGVTETSIKDVGLIRSTIALAPLLIEGIGNTIRISLSDDPIEEIKACKRLLHDLGLYDNYYTIISCPMCGRTTANTKDIAELAIKLLDKYKLNITVACMGCVVNGIGEGMQADLGIACSNKDNYVIFKKGKIIENVNLYNLYSRFEEHLKNWQK
ncbi:MAG: flavodoxin-dependent (E)-4-hydroxy-3-methylbut-2-enyl-diphosphate synthase [Erysipelotrichaceae bacterium]|nr:flavodoxin-dependent (E)-4-hydroxy-3-methylbut-2-enyl-diphosphate synthase [Erysipelotrichaceae bacterium]